MHRVEHIMGMPIVVAVKDDEFPDDAVEHVYSWFRWVDAVFSTYRADSEISRINSGELAAGDAEPGVRVVLDRCEELRDATEGFFDIHAASEHDVDPSGYVKGWSVDRAAAILDHAGVRCFAINAGGDMILRGGPWRVGIQHPLETQTVAKVIEVSDLAVATSGAYERGAHVLDPHTAKPPTGVLSVTITGPDLATADAYATAAFAMGAQRATHWTARLRGYEAMTILADERVLSTPGFPSI